MLASRVVLTKSFSIMGTFIVQKKICYFFNRGVGIASETVGVRFQKQPPPDVCHDLKSGFMEKRMQDLTLATPYLGDSKEKITNPTIKTTHPDW